MMNCIIVDDNKMARTAIKLLIDQVDFLNLKQECATPIEAFNYLQKEEVDLVFLDVEMPGMTGIELVKNLEKRPIIILITSKQDYAVEAFELNVADYIMKPVTLPRFTMAVSKAKELFDTKDQVVDIKDQEKGYIFVRSNSILTKIQLNDIIYIQALGDYVNIYTGEKDKRYTIHCTLRSMEEKLPAYKFYRLHRSYLVSLDHIDTVEDNTAYVGKNFLPIGEQFKKELLKKLNLV
jgi:two-component system LytT family response regulator